jgi:hypothetical protein
MEINAGALQAMAALRKLDVRALEVSRAQCFVGALASKPQTLRQSFSAGTWVTDVTVTAARFLSGNAFADCSSIRQSHLPSVLEFFGDGHFH